MVTTKTIILSVLVGLTALPAAAAVDHEHAEWTGDKRQQGSTDKLECKYKYVATGGEHYGDYFAYTWQQSMEHGVSPHCPVSLWDSGLRWWHVTGRAKEEYNNWKHTKQYSDYQFIKSQEKIVRDSDATTFTIATPDGRAAQVSKDSLLWHLGLTRIGQAEPYADFLANNTQGYVDTTWMWPEYKEQFFRGFEKLTYAANIRY